MLSENYYCRIIQYGKERFIMFVCFLTIKNRKSVRILLILMLCAVLIIGLIIFAFITRNKNNLVINGRSLSATVSSRDDVVRIGEFFELKIKEEDITEEKIVIPLRFNSVYEEYNRLQTDLGTDLSRLSGKTCVKYSAPLCDTDNDNQAVLTILCCDGRFIGGDVSSREFGGFILPLTGYGVSVH